MDDSRHVLEFNVLIHQVRTQGWQRGFKKGFWKRKYYGLNTCISPKFLYWSPNSEYDCIWRWGLWEVIERRWCHEGRILMMELVPLQEGEETKTLSFSAMWEYNEKMAMCRPGRISPDTESPSTLISHFPDFRTLRNTCLLFKLPSVWYFAIATQTD